MSESEYAVAGFDAVGIAAGIKKNNAMDLAIIASQVPLSRCGCLYKNAFAAAPVTHGQRLLSFNPEQVHGVVINSGNANACTGVEGDANTQRMAELVEQSIGAMDNSIFVMSTGVIGAQLPMDKILNGIPIAVDTLHADGWDSAAKAIMTTDTVHKVRTRDVEINGQAVKLTGICKGAGMIHPDMATMLSVISTDAYIAQPLLQEALSYASDRSFNRISVDGDTSTNDTVLVLANGLAEHNEIADAESEAFIQFRDGLTAICTDLAQALVRDGEGVTKFIAINVNGGKTDEDAHLAANTIAISPLCKTAFYGNDANWGRFVMALGRSGAQVDPSACSIFISGGQDDANLGAELQLLDNGAPTGYAEDDAMAIFAQPEIDVRIELDQGAGNATVWTGDLSHDYVTINAEYRT